MTHGMKIIATSHTQTNSNGVRCANIKRIATPYVDGRKAWLLGNRCLQTAPANTGNGTNTERLPIMGLIEIMHLLFIRELYQALTTQTGDTSE